MHMNSRFGLSEMESHNKRSDSSVLGVSLDVRDCVAHTALQRRTCPVLHVVGCIVRRNHVGGRLYHLPYKPGMNQLCHGARTNECMFRTLLAICVCCERATRQPTAVVRLRTVATIANLGRFKPFKCLGAVGRATARGRCCS